MRRILLSAAALSVLGTASLHAQSYQQLTNSLGGAGCAGSLGIVPNLSSNDLPRINRPFTLRVSAAPQPVGLPGLMAFVYGFSKTDWGSIPLPYDLGNLGIFNCFAHVALDVVIPMTYTAGTFNLLYTLHIPNDPNLVGLDFYNQCGFFDPLAIPLFNRQVTVSNAMEGVVGM